MKLIVENLYGYNPSYGKNNWNIIVEAGKKDAFDEYLGSAYPDGIKEAALDALLWDDQEMEQIFKEIGIKIKREIRRENNGVT